MATLLTATFDLIGSQQPCFVVWLVCQPLQLCSWSAQVEVGAKQTIRLQACQHHYGQNAVATAVRQAWRAANLHKQHPHLPPQAVFFGQVQKGSHAAFEGCWLRAVVSALLRGNFTPLQPQSGHSIQLLSPQSNDKAVHFVTQCLNLSEASMLPCSKLAFTVQSKDYWEPAIDNSLRKLSRRVAVLDRRAAHSKSLQGSYQSWRIRAAQSDPVLSNCVIGSPGSRRASGEFQALADATNDSLLPQIPDTKLQKADKVCQSLL